MADELSTAPVDATDTSTSEEDVEASMEDIEISPEDTKSETSEESTEESDATESEEETESTEDETTEDVEDQEDAQETEEVEQSDEEKQKAFNKEMAEKRIQAKQERDSSIKQQQNQYLAGVEDPIELATRQNQIALYNLQVDTNTNKLTNGYERAVKDFDILKSDDPVIRQAVDDALDAFQAMYVTLDAYGNPTEMKGDLYTYLQSKADSISQLTQIGKRTQEKDKGKEKSKTFTPPSRTPKEPKVDPDLAAFDEEVDKLFAL